MVSRDEQKVFAVLDAAGIGNRLKIAARGTTEDSTTRAAEDQRLIDRWHGGDERAFEEIYQRYLKRIFTLSLRLTRSQTDAEDVTAETFARAYEGLRKVRSGGHLLPWLSRVALNLCRDLGRRRTTRKTYSYDDRGEGQDNIALQVPDTSSEPLGKVVASELRETVARAVQDLPDWQRETVILFYLNDKSVDEIAKLLDVREGTVKSRLARAREALRGKLSGYVAQEGAE